MTDVLLCGGAGVWGGAMTPHAARHGQPFPAFAPA